MLAPGTRLGAYEILSTMGGARPLWARSGRELVYVSPAAALMAVGVERAQSWAATTPATVVKEGYFTNPAGLSARMYDIAPDGERFLMIKNPPGADQTAASANLVVVQNWFEELKRLVPVK